MAVNKKNIMTRYFFVVLLMSLTGIAVVVKAGLIMFAEQGYWKDVADRFVREGVPVRPNRGNILSADGKLMASSLPEYRIYMDFKAGGHQKDTMLMNHLTEICEGLHKIFPDRSVAQFKSHLLKGRKKGSRNYLIYPKRISYIQYKEAKRLPVFNLNKYKGGFHELAYNQRKKPFGSLAARTLGDVYADTAQGAKNGIELAFDSLLKGREGITHRQKVMNKYLNIVDRPPVDGCDIITTIDVDMQDICEKALVDKLKELEAVSGVAILMDVPTGDVKAIVNMTRGQDGNYYEMRNLAISNNWHRGGYGAIDVNRIMEVSSNIGVSSIIDKYYKDDPQKFVDGLKRMSIDQPLHLQIPGEGTPNIKGPKEKYFAKTTLPWMSIGYEVQLPPINILTFYNAIANNGKMVRPRFVTKAVKDGDIVEEFPVEVINEKICSDRTLEQIRTILRNVVGHGLAKPAGSDQFNVSGKTGTAQISQGAAGYKSGVRNHLVSFCGYFPSEQPRYSCIVSIQINKGIASGGGMAGSVFGKIAERVYAKNLHFDLSNAVDSTTNVIPVVKAGNMNETVRVLEGLQVPVQKDFKLSASQTTWGHAQQSPNAVILQAGEDKMGLVPNVIGMGAKDAVYLLESKGLRVQLYGIGRVRSQSIAGGSRLVKGQTVALQLRQ